MITDRERYLILWGAKFLKNEDEECADIAIEPKKRDRKSRADRKRDRLLSPNFLKENGINFSVKDGGVHLIVESKRGVIDFWPGTGLFIPRNTGFRMQGVQSLLDFCGKELNLTGEL